MKKTETAEQIGDFHKIHTLFCQHCKALQKCTGIKADCWWNPLDHGRDHAYCAANQDAVKELFNLCRSRIQGELCEELKTELEKISEYVEYPDARLREFEEHWWQQFWKEKCQKEG